MIGTSQRPSLGGMYRLENSATVPSTCSEKANCPKFAIIDLAIPLFIEPRGAGSPFWHLFLFCFIVQWNCFDPYFLCKS